MILNTLLCEYDLYYNIVMYVFSGNVMGGFLAVSSFFYNHGEVSLVLYTSVSIFCPNNDKESLCSDKIDRFRHFRKPY